ncbi:MAG: TIGR03013 family XrtA/PEP-CTERM system glycosyltransferase [Betaproteobacteria bacterium]
MVRLFNHWFPSNAVLHVAFDAILLFVTFMLAATWLNRGDLSDIELLMPSAILFAVVMAALNTMIGLYQRDPYRTGVQTAARVMLSLLLSLPVAYTVFRVLSQDEAHQEALKLAAVGALAVLAAVRGYFTHWGSTPMFVRRVLVFGTGPEAAAVERSLRQFGPSMSIVGFYPVPNQDGGHDVAAENVFPMTLPLAETARHHGVDDLIVAVRERRGGALPLNELLQCKLSGVRVLDLSSYYERALGQVRLDTLHASWLIFGDGFRQGFLRALVKRVFDVVVSLAVFVVALPIMVLAVIAIALEDGFPVLYRQERIGEAGRVFQVIKFRSMRQNAEHDGKPRWATSNDDRVTRVGRVMRKLRIDELPQLINVLKGDMSLVGPRPERPFFVDKLTREVPFYAARHSVKPGVTGWAQIRYRYGASVDDSMQKLQYDLYYVKNHTLFLDMLVLFETIGVVITGKGAQ